MQNLNERQKAGISSTCHDYTIIGKTLVNPDFTFRDPNEQLCKLLGLTAAELKDKTFMDITPPLINEIDMAMARLVMKGEIPSYILPKPYKPSKDASLIYALISVTPVKKDDGAFECFYVEIMEIDKKTYIKLTRELLRSHPGLLVGQHSWVVNLLLLLQKCSVEDLYKLTVRIVIIGLAVVITIREGREKVTSVLTGWLP